jgi:hypothetical protein
MRALWQAAPCVAAAIEVHQDASVEEEARMREFLGWAPADGVDAIALPGAVDQLFVGMPAEQLEAIKQSIDLVPQRLLDLDSFVAASFEWLSTQKKRPGPVERWWSENKRAVDLTVGPAAAERVACRKPHKGVVDWAALPAATLAFAYAYVTDARAGLGGQALAELCEATAFAPRLVERDVVLAYVLATIDGYAR